MTSLAPSLPPGVLVNGYRLGRCLGRGAMGEVYEAVRESINKRVALKILRHGTDVSLNAARRLLEEARSANVIHHPSIVQVFDVGLLERTRPYLVMELLEGRPLSSALREGPLPLDVALETLEHLLEAVAASHRAGVIHRDLKPSNVFLTATGIKLLDFGVARREGRAEVLTAAATTVGSIGFMAPEQLRGNPVPASDLYAVGCLAFLMFSGRPVFPTRNIPENARMHLLTSPRPLREVCAAASPRLEAWVALLLEKEIDARPASAEVALARLRAASAPESHRTELVPAFTPPGATSRTRPHSKLIPSAAPRVGEPRAGHLTPYSVSHASPKR